MKKIKKSLFSKEQIIINFSNNKVINRKWGLRERIKECCEIMNMKIHEYAEEVI